MYVGSTAFAPCKRLFVGCTDFCVRIRLVSSRQLVRINTSFALKATFSYVYDLCAWSGLCVQIRLFVQSDLLRTYTTCALEATYAYEYVFARKATYCVRIRLVRSKQLMCTSTSFRLFNVFLDSLTWQWQLYGMLSGSSDVAMTVVMGSRLFVQHCDDRCNGC